jgi:hypothetical protein
MLEGAPLPNNRFLRRKLRQLYFDKQKCSAKENASRVRFVKIIFDGESSQLAKLGEGAQLRRNENFVNPNIRFLSIESAPLNGATVAKGDRTVVVE